MIRKRSLLILCFSFAAPISITGCDSTTEPTGLYVGGTYQISQTAVDDTCGMSSAPVSFAGTVAHSPGGTVFTLTDTVGTRFSGTVQQDGTFVATATQGPDPGGQTYSERLEGRFTDTGFSASLRVDVTPRNCFFTRSWTAVKQSH